MKRAVRGDRPRTADEALVQRDVAEYILNKHGLDHRSIHGVEQDVVTVRRRYDAVANVKRVCAAVGRRRLLAALSVTFVTTSVWAVLAGLESTLWLPPIFALASLAVYLAPDDVFTDPDPAVERGRIVEDGMTDRQVMRRFAIHDERENYRSEKAKEQRKRQERKARSNRTQF